MRNGFATAALVVVVALGTLYSALLAQDMRSVWDGVYTEEQAKRGAALFDVECAGCHGSAGEGGGMAPALVGGAFTVNYDGQAIGDLFERTRTTMPVGKEGQLSAQASADITAFMLECNEFPAGGAELPSQVMMLKTIRFVANKP
jgi:mono/diheme cytochrome c family protein